MSQKGFTIPRFAVLILIIIMGAVAIGIYLLNSPQIFKTRATAVTWINAFNITNSQDQPLNCDAFQNPPVCATNTLTVKIAVKDLSLLNQSVLSEHIEGEEIVEEVLEEELPTATPIPTPTATPTPASSITPSGGILSIRIGEQELDFNKTDPVSVALSNEAGADLTAAQYDVPIAVIREDNSIQALVIKFDYQPGTVAATSTPTPAPTSTPTPIGSASSTPTPVPTATPRATGQGSATNKYDLNRDGAVNSIDASVFLQKWRGRNASDLQSIDFNGDGVVNIFDYSTLKGDLGR